MRKFVLTHLESTSSSPLGGKARALLSLEAAGFTVPEWAVVVPHTWVAWNEDPVATSQLVTQALTEALPAVELFAVRSSASDEDGTAHSFAGQLDSFLFVPREQLMAKIIQVWNSGFAGRIQTYCREKGLPAPGSPPTVLVQRMIDPDCAGIAFGADPVTGQRGVAVISSIWGLGTALVGGEVDGDSFRVDRSGVILSESICDKRLAHRFDSRTNDGFSFQPVPLARHKQPSLTQAQAVEIAELARAAGRHFARPQDIEWAIKDGRVHLLQSRPITTLSGIADPDGALVLWDNTNCDENYHGITTPLTFSFARSIYEEAYRQFCRLMGVSAAKVADHRNTFQRMLGLVRGRVYYNLLSWYRVLSLLPGFATNRRFMEQMMGLKEPLPERMLAEFATTKRAPQGWKDRLDLLRTVASLCLNWLKLERSSRGFRTRLDSALQEPAIALADQRADELAAHYLWLQRQLLRQWDAPFVNDFFAMIFYGMLRTLCRRWCGDQDGTLASELVTPEGSIISAEPARRMKELGAVAAQDRELVGAMTNGSLPQIRAAISRNGEFAGRYSEYLSEFGDRCLEEMKLETRTLHDEPLTMLRTIGQIAQFPAEPRDQAGGIGAALRAKAEARIKHALRLSPLRTMAFRWILHRARTRVRDRENLRFARTRIFGRVRRIFLEIGKRFYASDCLSDFRDIFYLSVEEVLGYIDGTALTTDLKSLVEVRKREFQGYEVQAAPAERFATTGVVHHGNAFTSSKPSDPDVPAEVMRGIGCCPGVVRGIVRVVLEPRQAQLERGEILVAARTDPGWIMLFPAASGLLVEHGNLLSHAAIVARELGLPAIVSVAGLTRLLKTGDLVEFDGSTGTIRKLSEPAEGPTDRGRDLQVASPMT